MKESTKQKKIDEKFAEMMGMTIEEVRELRSKSSANDHVREAQAVLIFLEHPDAFITKICTECRRSFATTYQHVSNCSTECRVKSLEKIGIDWNPLRSADERWKRASIPVDYTIPSQALAVLIELAKSHSPHDVEQTLDIEPLKNVSPESLIIEPPDVEPEVILADESLFEFDLFD